MSFGRFIKQNFALTVGIAMPVVLVIGFLAVSIIPKSLSAPPQYKIAYTVSDYNGQAKGKISANLIAKNGKIILSMTKSQTPVYNREKLMVYDFASNKTQEIAYALPAGLRGEAEEEQLSETKNLTLSTDNQAPDSYVYDDAHGYNSGFVTELFSGGSRMGARAVKGAVAYKIPGDKGYSNIQFLGWIVKDEAE